MKTENPKKQERIDSILNTALNILRDKGANGLTMRQVASHCNITLSNVQYYFKNRDELLRGMVSHCLGNCEKVIEEHLNNNTYSTHRELIHSIIKLGMVDNRELTELRTIFREFQAISSRNPSIKAFLENYYAEISERYSALFNSFRIKNSRLIAGLIISFTEGYSVASSSFNIDRDRVIDHLTQMMVTITEDTDSQTT